MDIFALILILFAGVLLIWHAVDSYGEEHYIYATIMLVLGFILLAVGPHILDKPKECTVTHYNLRNGGEATITICGRTPVKVKVPGGEVDKHDILDS